MSLLSACFAVRRATLRRSLPRSLLYAARTHFDQNTLSHAFATHSTALLNAQNVSGSGDGSGNAQGGYDTAALRVMESTSTNPFFNLAVEEYIFRDADLSKQIFFHWRNEPTVVIGRNQNAWKECNLQRMEELGVHLVRRSSGGGAVYQDLGNTNFTFLSSLAMYDKHRNSEIILKGLKDGFGVKGEASGRNDLLVDGKKFSGSAYKQSGERAFHHGTLLVDVDTDMMQQVLTVNKEKLKSKGVASVKARVVNLKTLNTDIAHETLFGAVKNAFVDTYDREKKLIDVRVETVDESLLETEPRIKAYYDNLLDWDWRFGRNPSFSHELETRFEWGIIDLRLEMSNGVIDDVALFSDCLYVDFVDAVRHALEGARYDADGVRGACAAALATLNAQNASSEAIGFIQPLEEWLLKAM